MSDGEDNMPARPSRVYVSEPASAVDSALTLAASQPSSPFSLSSAKKEMEISPLDRAGADLLLQQKKEEGSSGDHSPSPAALPKGQQPPNQQKPAAAAAAAAAADAAAHSHVSEALVAWSQVLAGFLFNSVAWGTLSMFGVYELYYTETLGMSSASVSWIGSIQTFLAYLMCTLSGRLSDAGYSVPTALVGTALVVGAGIWMSFCTGIGGLFASQAVFTGIGLGLLSTPALPSMGAFFAPTTTQGRYRSIALCASTVGTSAGGAVLPAIVQYLLPVIGFGWAVRCATLVSLVACLLAILLVRPPRAATANGDQSMSPPAPTDPRPIWRQLIDWSALREPALLLFTLSTFFMFWATYFGFYYINSYAVKVVGTSTNEGALLLILATILGVPSRVPSGVIADHFMGALDILTIMLAVMAIVLYIWLAVGTSYAGTYVFAVLLGLANGGSQGVWLAGLAELVPATEEKEDESDTAESSTESPAPGASQSRKPPPEAANLGSCFGMVCTVGAFATLAGSPTAAAIIAKSGEGDRASDYTGAIIWAGSVTMVSALLVGAARVYVKGWRLHMHGPKRARAQTMA